MSRLNVLIVEHKPELCENLTELLTADGCEVLAVSDPKKAIQHLRSQEQYHILILEIHLPGQDGLELLGRIRKFDKDIAVITMTATPTLESATDAINLGVSAYLQQPFSGSEMRETVARVARKKGIVVRREDELHLTIGKRIREFRRARELTLKHMSRRTNLSVSLLSQIERAESSASVSSLYKIANALDVRISELFGDY